MVFRGKGHFLGGHNVPLRCRVKEAFVEPVIGFPYVGVDMQTDQQTDRQTDRDRQTETDRPRERERLQLTRFRVLGKNEKNAKK